MTFIVSRYIDTCKLSINSCIIETMASMEAFTEIETCTECYEQIMFMIGRYC